jgi:hypothetical protein
MSPQRYRALLSYLPGMAVVVNSFQSPEVQRHVYDELIEALNAKLDTEGAGPEGRGTPRKAGTNGKTISEDSEIAHDLVEGASIHAELPRG